MFPYNTQLFKALLYSVTGTCISITNLLHDDCKSFYYLTIKNYLLQELIQNAEDAGARKVKILYDGRRINRNCEGATELTKYFQVNITTYDLVTKMQVVVSS